ncbi:hypothetical protein CP556_01230 [Natrinema sp. CBA1119]|uniref:hypothetical protein n=1 Tax=Natrinema sp. CBA1119 TaxID=1608465 RepID=UPI000BF74580|nr:hypothetical protein [Natrinema sp. CBA1119]PGF14877.1 hypothetical protein CP556_01230 [Natrinema sp. CBA1119]
MIEDLASDGAEERSDLDGAERASSRPDEAELMPGPPRRVLTDGGQAEMEESDAERDDDSSEEASGDEGQGVEEPEGEAAEAESEDEPETEDEAETEDESEAEDESAEEPEIEAESEGEDADEDEGEADENEYHVEGADEVYQGDDASGVVHLDLDGLFLDLLGLEVNLDPVTLDVSARPGENNLLGNLLSAVSGLLDGPGAMIDTAKSLLSKPIEFVKSLLNKPVEKLTGLFGGDEEASEADAEEEEASESEEESPGPLSSAVQRLKDGVMGAASWVREKLAELVPSVPTEEIVSAIVSATLEQLLEQLEPDQDEESGGQAEPSQAEAA